MKKPALSAALVAAALPSLTLAGFGATATGRPIGTRIPASNTVQAVYVGGQAGYGVQTDPATDQWLVSMVEQIHNTVVTGQNAQFVSLVNQARAHLAGRTPYQHDLNLINHAFNLILMQNPPAAAASLQQQVASVRQRMASYNQPGYGQPGYGQPGYGQPGHGHHGGNAGMRPVQRQLWQVSRLLREGRTLAAQRELRQLQGQLRSTPSLRHLARRVGFLAQNLRPGSEAWAMAELQALQQELRYA